MILNPNSQMTGEITFSDLTIFFWLDRGREGFRSSGGGLYWLKFISELDKPVPNEDENSLVIAPADAYIGKGLPHVKQEKRGRLDDTSRTSSTRF